MAIKTSGTLSFSEIQSEFGGSNPISMSEYIRGGSLVPNSGSNGNIPTTTSNMRVSQFYGAARIQFFTISSSQKQLNLATYLSGQGWDGSAPVNVTVASGVYLWSDSTSVGGLTIPSSMNGLVTLTNYGYIIGRGGNGGARYSSGQAGGPALVNQASGVTLTNASGAYIAGGGGGGAGGTWGGGGGGAGGGSGGNGYYLGTRAGGAGGSIGNSGSSGSTGKDTTRSAAGGGAGGGGADQTSWFGGGGGGGGGGGRILPGTGGLGGLCSSGGSNMPGGHGGSSNNAGSNFFFTADYSTTGGGGGWGAKGGGTAGGNQYGGGSGGAAISGTSVSLTNSGTIYGSVA